MVRFRAFTMARRPAIGASRWCAISTYRHPACATSQGRDGAFSRIHNGATACNRGVVIVRNRACSPSHMRNISGGGMVRFCTFSVARRPAIGASRWCAISTYRHPACATSQGRDGAILHIPGGASARNRSVAMVRARDFPTPRMRDISAAGRRAFAHPRWCDGSHLKRRDGAHSRLLTIADTRVRDCAA
jgi:hypothetical protein